LVDDLDYKIPVTQQRSVRGRWRYATRKATVPKIAHPTLLSLFSLNFLMDASILKFVGIKMN